MDIETAVLKATAQLQELEGLGSPDAIADFLKLQGCNRFLAFEVRSIGCPVAQWINLAGLSGMWVYVGRGECVVCLGEDEYGQRKSIDNPKTVKQFIANFDCGYYPFLRADVSHHVPAMDAEIGYGTASVEQNQTEKET